MEEEASSRRSVAELAGRFKGSAAPHDAAGQQTEKPVRRRPPRTLQLPEKHGDDQEPPGVTSPVKVKRNSALIEKLQANLALSPTAMLPCCSPKSPGFRLLPPGFPPPSSVSAPVTPATNSSTATPTTPVAACPFTEQEAPTSFETPPTVTEGSILSNTNIKERARHSIRRRPPSRRLRKSSSGDDVGEGDKSLSSSNEPEDKTTTTEGGEKEGGGEAPKQEGQTDELKEDKTDASTCPEEHESHEEVKPEVCIKSREEDEKKKEEEEDNRLTSGTKEEKKEEEEEDRSSSGTKDEKKEENGSSSGTKDVKKKDEEEKNRPTGEKEVDGSSSGTKEEEQEEAQEKTSEEKQEEGVTEGAMNTDKEEEKIQESTAQCPVR